AAAGGHPERDLVELEARVLGLLQCRDPVRFRERLVQRCNARVECLSQAGGVAEVAVEVDLREQQRQVLEVLPDDRFFAPGDAPVVEVLRDRNDGLVVLQQLLEEPIVWKYLDRKSTRLNSSHVKISYAVFCLKKTTKYGSK